MSQQDEAGFEGSAPVPEAATPGELGMTITFILIFLPAFGLFWYIFARSIIAYRHGAKAVFMVVVSVFQLGVIARIIQGAVFLSAVTGTTQRSDALESFVNFWVPYFIAYPAQYAILVSLLCFWNLLLFQATGKTAIHRRLRIAISVVAAAVFVITFVLLLSIQPTEHGNTNGQDILFRYVYFAFNIVFTVVAVVAYSIMWHKLKRFHADMRDEVSGVNPKRLAIFCSFVVAIYILRLILEIAITFVTSDNELLYRTLEFLWHAVPELALNYAFIGIMWKHSNTIPELTSQMDKTNEL